MQMETPKILINIEWKYKLKMKAKQFTREFPCMSL